uniref:Uncharacterized protein n=1 Tax=Physcomitrium patens TaxID=3218 RepID=A0A2K1J6K0_PHYPA|nr:hypothetical protein PHYPA_020272 [Physcomitrium patens]
MASKAKVLAAISTTLDSIDKNSSPLTMGHNFSTLKTNIIRIHQRFNLIWVAHASQVKRLHRHSSIVSKNGGHELRMFRSVRFNPLLANSKPIVKRTTSNPHVYQIRKLSSSAAQSNLKTKAKTTDSNNCDASYLRGSKARIVDETTSEHVDKPLALMPVIECHRLVPGHNHEKAFATMKLHPQHEDTVHQKHVALNRSSFPQVLENRLVKNERRH